MKKLNILVGDDVFDFPPGNGQVYVFQFMRGIADAYGLTSPERVRDEGFVFERDSPIPEFDKIRWTLADTVQGMIEKSKQEPFDWLVSDMDYGPGYREGGLMVMRQIPKEAGMRAIYTSNDNVRELQNLKERAEVDFFISPLLEPNTKFDNKFEMLGYSIGKFYQDGFKKE
ncbi:MAG: hypothetical protein ACMXYK_03815 [Candidatus Woesearchaeota archaeon]